MVEIKEKEILKNYHIYQFVRRNIRSSNENVVIFKIVTTLPSHLTI